MSKSGREDADATIGGKII